MAIERLYYMRKDHKATRIVIKRAEVDLKMQPVIKWLNSYPGIFTRWSCEGDDTEFVQETLLRFDGPYILFYCDEQLELNKILHKLEGYAVVIIDFYRDQMIRYCIRFYNVTRFKQFIRRYEL